MTRAQTIRHKCLNSMSKVQKHTMLVIKAWILSGKKNHQTALGYEA
jgi:hypothetical protein